MPVERALIAVLVGELPEVAEVPGELLRWDRGVFPPFPRVGLVGDERRRAEAALTHLPDVRLVLRVVEQPDVDQRRALAEVAHHPARARICLLAVRAAQLDQQPTAPVGQVREVLDVHAFRARIVHQLLVDPFQCERPVRKDRRDVFGGREDVFEAGDEHRAVRRPVDEAHRCAQHGHQSALAADQRARDVEPVLGEQLIEVVAGNAPRDLRVARADLLRVSVAHVSETSIDLAGAAASFDRVG